jgi:hypothetical protein
LARKVEFAVAFVIIAIRDLESKAIRDLESKAKKVGVDVPVSR